MSMSSSSEQSLNPTST